MRSPDSIQVLLQVRCRKAELEERKLVALIEKIKLAETELVGLSEELGRISAARAGESQCVSPNVHHQAMEMQVRALWQRRDDQKAEIERLRELRVQQMSAYTSAHQKREVVAKLEKQRSQQLEIERYRREQKLNEDLFLARRVAKWDTRSGEQ